VNTFPNPEPDLTTRILIRRGNKAKSQAQLNAAKLFLLLEKAKKIQLETLRVLESDGKSWFQNKSS
jgi:hypothetical protein